MRIGEEELQELLAAELGEDQVAHEKYGHGVELRWINGVLPEEIVQKASLLLGGTGTRTAGMSIKNEGVEYWTEGYKVQCYRGLTPEAMAMGAIARYADSGCWECGKNREGNNTGRSGWVSHPLLPESYASLRVLLEADAGLEITLKSAAEYLAAGLETPKMIWKPSDHTKDYIRALCKIGHLQGLLQVTRALAR